ncbi:hypothetical protein F5146DRAFT_1180906 [Armillaria mellea]|nr:hypothetical protein F5146DRAFT_1180906 [Armillaria mellea]
MYTSVMMTRAGSKHRRQHTLRYYVLVVWYSYEKWVGADHPRYPEDPSSLKWKLFSRPAPKKYGPDNHKSHESDLFLRRVRLFGRLAYDDSFESMGFMIRTCSNAFPSCYPGPPLLLVTKVARILGWPLSEMRLDENEDCGAIRASRTMRRCTPPIQYYGLDSSRLPAELLPKTIPYPPASYFYRQVGSFDMEVGDASVACESKVYPFRDDGPVYRTKRNDHDKLNDTATGALKFRGFSPLCDVLFLLMDLSCNLLVAAFTPAETRKGCPCIRIDPDAKIALPLAIEDLILLLLKPERDFGAWPGYWVQLPTGLGDYRFWAFLYAVKTDPDGPEYTIFRLTRNVSEVELY